MDSARLFLALWPGPALRRELLAQRAAWAWDGAASLVATDDLHITLHFIGSVQRARLPELIAGLKVPFDAFELRLDRAELWAHGIAVLLASRVPERLLQLHAALGVALTKLALPTDSRAPRPHVTLARRAAGSSPAAVTEPLRWRARGYALVESQPAALPRYSVLQRYA